jgi:hypothetical protein
MRGGSTDWPEAAVPVGPALRPEKALPVVQ